MSNPTPDWKEPKMRRSAKATGEKQPPFTPITKWEYKVVGNMAGMDDDAMLKFLNELGAEGWQFCGRVGTARAARDIFKRQTTPRPAAQPRRPYMRGQN